MIGIWAVKGFRAGCDRAHDRFSFRVVEPTRCRPLTHGWGSQRGRRLESVTVENQSAGEIDFAGGLHVGSEIWASVREAS